MNLFKQKDIEWKYQLIVRITLLITVLAYSYIIYKIFN